jgi:thiosulfate/3-mercaptopyruvate sulfurtransferase
MNSIISAAELKGAQDIILIDARSGPQAKLNFLEQHLAGALHADLDTDLAEVPGNASLGGRHPLPDVKKFGTFISSLGITPTSHVVVYDDKSGANAAARFWWMMRAIDHKNIQVLNGGLQAALATNYRVESGPSKMREASIYPVSTWLLPRAEMNEVIEAAASPDRVVIDVREAGRYRGEFEPIDLVAGHIPGAINIPFAENLQTDGTFKSPEELKSKYTQTLGQVASGDVIVHCGSGVTACHTLLAMDYAGLEMPKLYVGSWSEWSRNDLPIATGPQ